MSTTEPETGDDLRMGWLKSEPVMLSVFTHDPPPDVGMNPVRRWLVNVMKECGSPEEVERVARTVRSPNTRAMLLRGAERWRISSAASAIEP